MATLLIRPDNGQPCDFISNRDGWVQLRTLDTITPMTRWYSAASVQACNPNVDITKLKAVDPRLTGMVYGCEEPPIVYTCALPPQTLTVTLTPEMAASVNASAGVRIVVMPKPTLWHERLIA